MPFDFLSQLTDPHAYTRDEIIHLLSVETPDAEDLLFKSADEVRHGEMGDSVHLRGIIEISNECDRACLYCGLRKWNTNLPRYRMSPRDIIHHARMIVDLPVRSLVLQAGEANTYSRQEIAEVVQAIRAHSDAGITLSLGEKHRDDYQCWFDAGADRYLLKHETRNSDLFQRLKPDSDMERRTECLFILKDIGFQVGTGNMVGLPGQTLGDIADDLLFCRDLDADMCSFGPFIASPSTPLSEAANGTVALSLRTIAAARLVLRNVHIPANTAIATLDEEGREKALQCGANVVMPNFTPSEYRIHYQIYPHRKCITDEPLVCNGCIRGLIVGLGRTVADDAGHSLKLEPRSATPFT